jgi:predicted nucleic acid-binding protein
VIYLLDSNVLSELWKPKPDDVVVAWFYSSDWYLPVPVIAEIQEGAEASPSVARRREINAKLDAFLKTHGATVMDWDVESARTWGRLKHSPEVKRKPQAFWDSLIDAMAVRHDATMATRNVKDFRHAKTFNPWIDKVRH